MEKSKLIQNLVNQIAKSLDLDFLTEDNEDSNLCFANSTELRDDYKTSFSILDILDYTFAVLNTSQYRHKYKAHLILNFPSLPYPTDAKTFWELVNLGGKLRPIHLKKKENSTNKTTNFPRAGNHLVTRKTTKTSSAFEVKLNAERIDQSQVIDNNTVGKVWINSTQYFDNVPQTAWEFLIGKHQPAQKWINNRMDKVLSFEDVLFYQNLIIALAETVRLLKTTDHLDAS